MVLDRGIKHDAFGMLTIISKRYCANRNWTNPETGFPYWHLSTMQALAERRAINANSVMPNLDRSAFCAAIGVADRIFIAIVVLLHFEYWLRRRSSGRCNGPCLIPKVVIACQFGTILRSSSTERMTDFQAATASGLPSTHALSTRIAASIAACSP